MVNHSPSADILESCTNYGPKMWYELLLPGSLKAFRAGKPGHDPKLSRFSQWSPDELPVSFLSSFGSEQASAI
jgi:hypothetical protein